MGGGAAAVLYFFVGAAVRAHDAQPGDAFVARGFGAAYGAEIDALVGGIGCLAATAAVTHAHCRYSRAPLVEAGVEEGVVVVSHDAADVAVGSGHRARAVAGDEGGEVVVSRDAADVVLSGHRARAVAGGESAGAVVSRDAAGVVAALHCYLAVAGDEGAVVVASHDAAYVAVARHLARHGQALHHAAVADGSEEALVV